MQGNYPPPRQFYEMGVIFWLMSWYFLVGTQMLRIKGGSSTGLSSSSCSSLPSVSTGRTAVHKGMGNVFVFCTPTQCCFSLLCHITWEGPLFLGILLSVHLHLKAAGEQEGLHVGAQAPGTKITEAGKTKPKQLKHKVEQICSVPYIPIFANDVYLAPHTYIKKWLLMLSTSTIKRSWCT